MVIAKILIATVLYVVYFLVIIIVWAEIFTIPRGYQIAGILGISGDEDVYNFIADLSIIISAIGSCILTFLSFRLLFKK